MASALGRVSGRTTTEVAIVVCLLAATAASAQGLPSEPISVANGRLVFGAEVTAVCSTSKVGVVSW